MYTVKTSVEPGRDSGSNGSLIDVQWYSGDDLAVALTAVMQAATMRDDYDALPEGLRPTTVAVTLEFGATPSTAPVEMVEHCFRYGCGHARTQHGTHNGCFDDDCACPGWIDQP